MNFSMRTAVNKLKHMKGQDWLIVILLGVLLLIVAIPSGALHSSNKLDGNSSRGSSLMGNNNEAENAKNNSSDSQSGQTVKENYVNNLEDELKTILEKMQGVGKVEVMITLKDDGEFFLDKDISSEKDSHKENSVIYNNGNNTNPYVTKENLPQIEGVLIVAEGGNNVETVTQITGSVETLFHVEAHKVKVIPMKS